MSITIIVTMCVINLVLWLAFFVKFKNLFSTEDVMKKTREEYGQLMNDINRNTLENINLIDSKIEELNDAIANAERRITAAAKEESFEAKTTSRTQTKRSKKAEPVKQKEPDVPKIYMTKNPIKPKRNFQERVVELFNLGYTIEQIAKETERSTTEVQFVIDML